MNKLELVKEWRRTFGLPVSEVPVVPSLGQLCLHSKLISDETDEIEDAQTHIDIRDVIADLHYFILGLASEAGVTKEQLDSDFASVHAANMAKLWSLNQIADTFSQEEAQFAAHSQVGWSREIQGGFNVTCQRLVYSGTEPGFVVRLNGKVQKPPGWKAAVLEGGAV